MNKGDVAQYDGWIKAAGIMMWKEQCHNMPKCSLGENMGVIGLKRNSRTTSFVLHQVLLYHSHDGTTQTDSRRSTFNSKIRTPDDTEKAYFPPNFLEMANGVMTFQ